MDIQIHNDQRTWNRLNLKRVAPRQFIIRLLIVKGKDRRLKTAEEKDIYKVIYKDILHKIISRSLNRNFENQDRMKWYIQILKAKLSTKNSIHIYIYKYIYITFSGGSYGKKMCLQCRRPGFSLVAKSCLILFWSHGL